MTDTDLRERLERLASQIAVEPLPKDRIVARGRRRRARRIAGSTIAAMAVIATFTWAAQAILIARPASRLPAGPGDITRIGGPGITSIRLPGGPRSLAFAEGRIWATAHDGKWPMVVSIDPRTGDIVTGPVRARVPAEYEASGLAAGDGRAWMVALPLSGTPRGYLLRIDPNSGATKRIAVGHRPLGVAFGFGAVWVANSDDDSVSRVDPATGRLVATIPVGHSPSWITVGEGRVWVNGSFSSNAVSGIDPSTNRIAITIPGIDEVAEADGWLWAVGSGRPNGAIVRIDPRSGVAEGPRVGLDIQPAELAAGEHTVWFTKWFDNPADTGPIFAGPMGSGGEMVRLVRIDPATGRQLGQPVTVDSLPRHPLVAAGEVWVASLEANAILRIDFGAPFGRSGN